MGLCLVVLDSDHDDDDGAEQEEIAECDVGHYSDFGCFRNTIARCLDARLFPTLMEHSDCDGEWSLADIPILERELQTIGAAFQEYPPEEPVGAFEHCSDYRVDAKSLYDCFHSVNGENLIEAILGLCKVAREHKRSITFS
jgi:Immunity protein 70